MATQWESLLLEALSIEAVCTPISEDCTYLVTMEVGMCTINIQMTYSCCNYDEINFIIIALNPLSVFMFPTCIPKPK